MVMRAVGDTALTPTDDAMVLPVDKPVGPTSHDVVREARRQLGVRRIGHTGTLDPFASGLLLLCVGRATRLAEYLSGLDKSYDATARLGQSTDTLDLEGEVVEESDAWSGLDRTAIADALAAFRGEIDQIPPQFSAKKVDGVPMHRRARRGETRDLEPCRVTVHSIDLLSADLPYVRFRMRCSSGTYVRCVARDLGAELGVGAHLTALRRTGIGSFSVSGAVSVQELSDPGAVRGLAVDPLSALGHLPAIQVDDQVARRLTHGQKIAHAGREDLGLVRVAHEGELIAVAEVTEGQLRPKKVFAA
jgi:tRNA pseudouridine55 synthase